MALEDQDEMETDLDRSMGNKISGEGNQGKLNEEELDPKGKATMVETLVEGEDDMDEFRVTVSHMDLIDNFNCLIERDRKLPLRLQIRWRALEEQRTCFKRNHEQTED